MSSIRFGGIFSAALLASAVLGSANAAPASLAVVAAVDGQVMVNTGKGYFPATAQLVLKAGDRVLVGKNSNATISYNDCAVSLDKPVLFTVTAEPVCAKSSVQPTADLPGGAYPPAGGGVAAAGGLAPVALPMLVVGSLTVACAVKCGDLLDDNEDPTSAD